MINKQWLGLNAEDKLVIRTTLNQFLLDQHTKVPTFIRNKLVKVIVDIGRIDWPHFYPDFLSNVMQVCTNTCSWLVISRLKKMHECCKGQHAHLECGRSWVQVTSNK